MEVWSDVLAQVLLQTYIEYLRGKIEEKKEKNHHGRGDIYIYRYIVLPQKCCLTRFKLTSFSFHFLWNTACTSGRTVVVDNDSGSPVPSRSEILISQKRGDKKLKSASDSGVACISGINFIMVPVKIARQHVDIRQHILIFKDVP